MFYFIYALVDPRTNEVTYVGLTNNPNSRFQDHMSNFGTNIKKSNWIRQLRDEHLGPRMSILEIVDTKEAATEREKYWINHYLSSGASLVNSEHTIPKQDAREDVWRVHIDESWVPMRQAAKLLGVSTWKIFRLAQKQKIKTQNTPFDERVRLVNMDELRALFASAPAVVKSEDGEYSFYKFRSSAE